MFDQNQTSEPKAEDLAQFSDGSINQSGQNGPVSAMPTEFQPVVEKTKKVKTIILILFGILIVGGLAFAGYYYRDKIFNKYIKQETEGGFISVDEFITSEMERLGINNKTPFDLAKFKEEFEINPQMIHVDFPQDGYMVSKNSQNLEIRVSYDKQKTDDFESLRFPFSVLLANASDVLLAREDSGTSNETKAELGKYFRPLTIEDFDNETSVIQLDLQEAFSPNVDRPILVFEYKKDLGEAVARKIVSLTKEEVEEPVLNYKEIIIPELDIVYQLPEGYSSFFPIEENTDKKEIFIKTFIAQGKYQIVEFKDNFGDISIQFVDKDSYDGQEKFIKDFIELTDFGEDNADFKETFNVNLKKIEENEKTYLIKNNDTEFKLEVDAFSSKSYIKWEITPLTDNDDGFCIVAVFNNFGQEHVRNIVETFLKSIKFNSSIANGNEITNPFLQVKARDKRRISDIRQIQAALELYYKDKGKYPILKNGAVLGKENYTELCADGFNSIGVACKTVYMAQIPTNPEPNGSDYIYHGSDGKNYNIRFSIETFATGFGPGELIATPEGIKNINEDTDTDNDGLSDAEETKWGTDPDNVDTDNDGYGDGDEIKNWYNPLGLGKMTPEQEQKRLEPWQTHKDEERGFMFNYPKEWTSGQAGSMTEQSSDNDGSYPSDENSRWRFNTLYKKESCVGWEDCYQFYLDGYSIKNYDTVVKALKGNDLIKILKQTTINENQVVVYTEGGKCESKKAFIFGKNQTIKFTGRCIKGYSNLEDDFDYILSTFRFL
jgi:hypothetical protein